MPPTQDEVIMWSSILAPIRAFRNYLGRLKKGRILAGANLERYTPAVRTASGGLRDEKRGRFAFPNFLLIEDIFTTISTIGRGRMFAQLISIGFISPIKVPSEALQLRSDFADVHIAEFITQNDKALIGVRPFGRTDAPVTKLSWRGA